MTLHCLFSKLLYPIIIILFCPLSVYALQNLNFSFALFIILYSSLQMKFENCYIIWFFQSSFSHLFIFISYSCLFISSYFFLYQTGFLCCMTHAIFFPWRSKMIFLTINLFSKVKYFGGVTFLSLPNMLSYILKNFFIATILNFNIYKSLIRGRYNQMFCQWLMDIHSPCSNSLSNSVLVEYSSFLLLLDTLLCAVCTSSSVSNGLFNTVLLRKTSHASSTWLFESLSISRNWKASYPAIYWYHDTNISSHIRNMFHVGNTSSSSPTP